MITTKVKAAIINSTLKVNEINVETKRSKSHSG